MISSILYLLSYMFIYRVVVGLERGPLSLVSLVRSIEELLE
jgi:hypothetical protein